MGEQLETLCRWCGRAVGISKGKMKSHRCAGGRCDGSSMPVEGSTWPKPIPMKSGRKKA
jgi:hypothetical protein